MLWPAEIRRLIDCLAVAAGLLAQEAAAPPPGTSWAFGCTLGLAQGTCGEYLAAANSRGAAACLGGCPSCVHRIADNCPVCGWKDGDGVTTCFYSPELGAVTHQNSDEAAAASMTAEQRSLFEAYSAPGLKRHTCGGMPHLEAPYHIACTGCGVEVKLWEHGVDYDVG